MQNVIDEAVEALRRKRFFEIANAGYARLREDPQAWADELAERQVWENTSLDGFDLTETWSEDGSVKTADPEAAA